MKFLTGFWRLFKKVGFVIGNFVSGIVLIVFYFIIFAIFAIPFRLSGELLNRKSMASNWIFKKANISNMDDFKNE